MAPLVAITMIGTGHMPASGRNARSGATSICAVAVMPHWWPAVVTRRRYSMPAHTRAGSHTTPQPRSAVCSRGVSTGTASNPATRPNAAATAALTPTQAGPVITSGGSMLSARSPKSVAQPSPASARAAAFERSGACTASISGAQATKPSAVHESGGKLAA